MSSLRMTMAKRTAKRQMGRRGHTEVERERERQKHVSLHAERDTSLRVEKGQKNNFTIITPPQNKETREKGTKIHTSNYTQPKSSKIKRSSWEK